MYYVPNLNMTGNQIFNLLYARKVPFLVVFFLVVTLTYAVLYYIDFIPEPVSDEVEKTKEVTAEEVAVEPMVASAEVEIIEEIKHIFPEKIIFEDLDREVEVLNPVSSDIADLDEALLEGAVRHPESADFGEDGNMFILAHSSYLPNVLNKNYQAFNGIQKLSWGDKIRVQSADMEYVYRVEKVYEAKASEVFVPETPGEAMLTLATCNSFAGKDDRFMVEARLIGSYAL